MSPQFIVRVKQDNRFIPDKANPFQPDGPIWFVNSILSYRDAMPREEVRSHLIGHIRGWPLLWHDEKKCEAMAEVYLWSAIAHPRTPFGLAAPLDGVLDEATPTLFHGYMHERSLKGVLTPTGTRAESWPDEDRWHAVEEIAVQMARATR